MASQLQLQGLAAENITTAVSSAAVLEQYDKYHSIVITTHRSWNKCRIMQSQQS